MHQCECEESDHTINEQIKNPKPKQMIAENKKLFQTQMQLLKKWTFCLSFANELREKNECNFWSLCLEISRAGKLNRAYRGRFASF